LGSTTAVTLAFILRDKKGELAQVAMVNLYQLDVDALPGLPFSKPAEGSIQIIVKLGVATKDGDFYDKAKELEAKYGGSVQFYRSDSKTSPLDHGSTGLLICKDGRIGNIAPSTYGFPNDSSNTTKSSIRITKPTEQDFKLIKNSEAIENLNIVFKKNFKEGQARFLTQTLSFLTKSSDGYKYCGVIENLTKLIKSSNTDEERKKIGEEVSKLKGLVIADRSLSKDEKKQGTTCIEELPYALLALKCPIAAFRAKVASLKNEGHAHRPSPRLGS
jgi:hypothetical protein